MGWVRVAILVMAGMLVNPQAGRADYPSRPVTVVVGFAAGGSTDAIARLLAPFLARHLGDGASVEVVNRPGASGELGFAAIADAIPDGHTIGFINTPSVVSIPIERSARFTLDRLDPLVNVVEDPGVWTVRGDSPLTTLAEAIAAARVQPGAISVGSTGIGSDDHLGLLMMQQLTGASFTHRSYPGSAAAHRALMAEHVHLCGQNVGEGLRARQTEAIRVLGVMSAQRWPAAPDIPTFAEQGFNVVNASQRGIAAPRGLPAAIRAQLVTALLAALADPEFIALAQAPATYQPLRVLPPDAFAAELRRQDARLRALWRRAPWLSY